MTTVLNTTTKVDEAITQSMIDDVCSRLKAGKRVKQALPGGGMLQIDRMLPFMCLYRRDSMRRDEGTAQLVVSEASFLSAPGLASERKGLRKLVRKIAETAAEQLGAFLLLEIWSGEDQFEVDSATGETKLPRPAFSIFTRQNHESEDAVATLEFALQQIRVHRKSALVNIVTAKNNHPPQMKALISPREESEINCQVLGLEVRPSYRDPQTGEIYDRVNRSFRRDLSHAIKKCFHSFALRRTTVRPDHYFSFGSSTLSKQVLAVDRQLAEISRQFKFLLLVTPVNAQRAWLDFSANGFRKRPVFQYRPLDSDPMLLKRRITKVATEKIDDPSLSFVFRQAQYELDRQVNMLADIGTERFLHGSIQVFGSVKPALRELAESIISRPTDSPVVKKGEAMSPRGFLRLAEKELEYYRSQSDTFTATATMRDDIYAGLMVTGGELLIGAGARIPKLRANALLQHEVGTHLVTYFNGSAQPLRMLQVGLADYDSLQEGLAVLSEYLVGGLSMGRLRTLAARVIAADHLVKGATFLEVFDCLVDEMKFEPRTAYTIALRVFRGGGLTKDALYLRGLAEILEYLGSGGDLRSLVVGKFAVEHVPIIRELTLSGVLTPPPLLPRYLESPEAIARLNEISIDTTVIDLATQPTVGKK